MQKLAVSPVPIFSDGPCLPNHDHAWSCEMVTTGGALGAGSSVARMHGCPKCLRVIPCPGALHHRFGTAYDEEPAPRAPAPVLRLVPPRRRAKLHPVCLALVREEIARTK